MVLIATAKGLWDMASLSTEEAVLSNGDTVNVPVILIENQTPGEDSD